MTGIQSFVTHFEQPKNTHTSTDDTALEIKIKMINIIKYFYFVFFFSFFLWQFVCSFPIMNRFDNCVHHRSFFLLFCFSFLVRCCSLVILIYRILSIIIIIVNSTVRVTHMSTGTTFKFFVKFIIGKLSISILYR